MVSFVPTLSGVSTNVLDMTGAVAPLLGAVVFGLFLSSLAGIVVTVLADRWQTRHQLGQGATQAADAGALIKAA